MPPASRAYASSTPTMAAARNTCLTDRGQAYIGGKEFIDGRNAAGSCILLPPFSVLDCLDNGLFLQNFGNIGV